mgnify:CR=1 FL=1
MAIIGDLTKGSSSGVGSAIVFGKFTDLLIRGLASIVLRVAESLKDLTWIPLAVLKRRSVMHLISVSSLIDGH